MITAPVSIPTLPREKIEIPRVHLNGTSREALLEQQLESLAALRAAMKVLESAAPNARDFYIKTPGAFAIAAEQHRRRIACVQRIIEEAIWIAEGIQAQP